MSELLRKFTYCEPLTFHRFIGLDRYTFIRNEWGWRVCCVTGPIDRVYRSYQVTLTPAGAPVKCSCADCYYRGNWCKHLKEADKIRLELDNSHAGRMRDQARQTGCV